MTNTSEALQHRIQTLAHTGRSAGAIAKILASEGYGAGASRASVGRVLAKLRGPVRSPRVTQSKKPAVATSLVTSILLDWCDKQDDPQAALELVLADLALHAGGGA